MYIHRRVFRRIETCRQGKSFGRFDRVLINRAKISEMLWIELGGDLPPSRDGEDSVVSDVTHDHRLEPPLFKDVNDLLLSAERRDCHHPLLAFT